MTVSIHWCQGNPGALEFILQLTSVPASVGHPIIDKIANCKSIRGTNLYVLWSDICQKDMNLVSQLCEKCPNEILEDACSRQDYSGRVLVAEYLDNQ